MKVNTLAGHELALHARRLRAQPVDLPTVPTQSLRQGKTREDVPASSSRHDQGLGTHNRPPCILMRFS